MDRRIKSVFVSKKAKAKAEKKKNRGNCAKYTIGIAKFVENAHCKKIENIVK